MTTFPRFFILALTFLLGVTSSTGPALLFGLTATLLLAGVSTLLWFTRESLHGQGRLWASVGLGVVLVTLVDLAVSVWLPGVRGVWGIYLNLLAFSPVIVVLPLKNAGSSDFSQELGSAVKAGLLLTLLMLGTALIREVLGKGAITLLPGLLSWEIPMLRHYPLTILATGAGGFFLAAAGVVAYRFHRRESPALVETVTTPSAPSPATVVPETSPETSGEWGETLAGVVADLASSGSHEKHRLLVIGSGNGELTYYLAMLCLQQAKTTGFAFQVRGTDHFSTRVVTAIRGVYRDHQIEFIEPSVRDAWMTPGDGEDRHLWKVAREPRLHVQFEVADFQQGNLFFAQPCHLIVLNQGIEHVIDEKKAHLLGKVCDQLLPGAALVIPGPFKRELLPEGMKRTGTTVFRKA